MNSYLNFIVEANICLFVFLLFYWLLLRNETNFNFKRMYLLGSVLFSLLFPIIKIGGGEEIPSLSRALPLYFLPEVVIGDAIQPTPTGELAYFSTWTLAAWIYLVGAAFFFLVILIQLIRLFMSIRRSSVMGNVGRFTILESRGSVSVFSFFNFVIIGNLDDLSDDDKEQIIRHELVHARSRHSFDIILIESVRVLFWFNPLVHILRKMISDIHEFQADEKAAGTQDIQTYCSLLARITIQSAGLSLANHFNKSLTLKRIAMLKTVKKKMSTWKAALILPLVILLFVAIACQEQVMEDLNEVVQNSSAALDVPANIQARYEELKKTNPGSQYILMELREEGQQKLTEMEQKYGLPKSVEVFRLGDQRYKMTGEASLKGESEAGIKMQYDEMSDESDSQRTFAIIEYSEQVELLSQNTVQDGEIFLVVEETAQPKDGIESFFAFIRENIKYPIDAKVNGIEGRVFIEFVVEKDGSLTNFNVLKGIGHGCDEEAVRVLSMSPPWKPALQRKQPVRQKMVMPIVFSTGAASSEAMQTVKQKMVVEVTLEDEAGDKIFLSGYVRDENGSPIEGINIIAKGKTYGTVTDQNGNWQLEVDKNIPLVFSHVGYKTEEVRHSFHGLGSVR